MADKAQLEDRVWGEETLTLLERQWLKSHPVIRIGVHPNVPPFEFIDDQGRYHGITPEYLRLISDRLQVTFQPEYKKDGTPYAWDEVLAAGRRRELDLIPCIVKTESRDFLEFTRSYMDFPWVVITREDHKKSGDLSYFAREKETVGIVKSYPLHEELADRYPGLKIIPVKDSFQGLTKVAQGRMNAFIDIAAVTVYLMKKHGLKQLKIAGSLKEYDTMLRMGVRSDWPILVTILNKAIDSLTPEEQAVIHNRWVSVELTSQINWKKIATVVLPVILLGLAILMVILAANRRLKKEVLLRRHAEDEFRIIADYTYGAESLHDECGKLRWVSRAVEGVTGYTAQECMQMPDYPVPIIIADDLPKWQDVCQAAMDNRAGSDIRVTILRKDGARRQVALFWNPVFRKDDEFYGFRVSTFDITDRLKAEEAIRKGEERFRFILLAAGAVYWQYDWVKNRFIYEPLQFFTHYGYSQEEIPETIEALYDLMHPDDREKVALVIRKHARGDTFFRVDYRIENKLTNGYIWLNSSGRLLEKGADGRFSMTAGLTVDITERQHLLEQIRQSQERLRVLAEHTHDWQTWRSLDGELLWVNKAMERISGYSIDEYKAMGDSIVEIIDERDRERFIEHLRRASQGEAGQQCHVRFHRKDGTIAWVSVVFEPVFGKDGQIIGIASSAKDITDQRAAEQELRLMSKVFENAADPIQIQDLKGRIINMNETSVNMYGYSREEVLGQHVSMLVGEDTMPRARELFHRCLNGEIIRNVDWERKGKDGKIYPLLLTMSLLKDDDDNPIAVASIGKDISDLKEAENKLKAYKDHLEELVEKRTAELVKAMQMVQAASKVKSEFLANMSHEIRTPLNAIIGFSHLATQTRLDAHQHDLLEKIQNSSTILLGVINDILDVSKIDAGKLELESTTFDLDEVLNNVSSLVSLKAREKGLEVILDIEPDTSHMLVGDPLRLAQILTNLANNAVKFTDKGRVVMGCRARSSEAELVELEFFVRDSGIGLSREQQNNLFQAFSQVDTSTTRKYGGTGLGLYITKTLVEMMGGRIWVDSEPGHGATFFFTVWLHTTQDTSLLPAQSGARDSQGRILLVEDDPLCRRSMKRVLAAMYFRVTPMDNAQAGLEELESALAQDPYDLVMMNWNMPGMDGLEAFKKIRHTLNLPLPFILMMSVFDREDLGEKIDKIKIDGSLVKPATPSAILDTVMTALGRQYVATHIASRLYENLPPVEAIAGAKLLVVEDNEINQEVIQGLLENHGFVVSLADNGKKALAALEENSYDAVLMDINMPEMDGYTACRKIRENMSFKFLPIIATTANAMAGDRQKALDAGMNDHVAKPIDLRNLLTVLRRWIAPAGNETQSPKEMGRSDKRSPSTSLGLDTLPGINLQAGLERLGGDIALYREILRKFALNQAGVAEELRKALETGDIETARVLSHTIKGVAGNISADKLFVAAAKLDRSLRSQNIERALEQLPVFAYHLERIVNSVKALENNNSNSAENDGGLDSFGKINSLLESLARMLKANDTAARSVMQALSGHFKDPAVEKIYDRLAGQVSSYEFEEAKKSLDTLCSILDIRIER